MDLIHLLLLLLLLLSLEVTLLSHLEDHVGDDLPAQIQALAVGPDGDESLPQVQRLPGVGHFPPCHVVQVVAPVVARPPPPAPVLPLSIPVVVLIANAIVVVVVVVVSLLPPRFSQERGIVFFPDFPLLSNGF